MHQYLTLNQKNSSLLENIDKITNNMKVQNRNVNLFHEKVQSTLFGSLLAARDNSIISYLHKQRQQQESQQLLRRNQQMMHE